MDYSIDRQWNDTYNAKIISGDALHGAPGEYNTKEHGHPVVIMESGVESFDPVMPADYHERRDILGPAKSFAEALEHVDLEDDERIYRDHPDYGELTPGSTGEVDYYVIEVMKLLDD